MDQVNFEFSTKNIPIPSEKDFIVELIKSVEKFVKNLKWRAFHYQNPRSNNQRKETFGFNTTSPPPRVPEIDELQEMLYDLVVDIKFKKHSNEFQTKLKNNIRNIANENKMFIAADKTSNFYKVPRDKHEELLKKQINKDYKKSDQTTIKNITKKDKEIAANLDIDDRIYTTSHRQAFITLKDHKPNFQNVQTCRLINPTKSEIGKVSKKILDKINSIVRDKSKVNQWKNTGAVIDWFRNITDKKRLKFVQFDICDFYASISEDLINESLDYAEQFVAIGNQDRKIIIQANQALLFDKETPWVKKGNSVFNVGMGSFDGAEICETIGLFLLSKLKTLKIDLGLYRDDGLGVCALTARQMEQMKKDMCRIFGDYGLRITVDVNHKIVNFLDVTFNLDSGVFKPFMKQNNTLLYVTNTATTRPISYKIYLQVLTRG